MLEKLKGCCGGRKCVYGVLSVRKVTVHVVDSARGSYHHGDLYISDDISVYPWVLHTRLTRPLMTSLSHMQGMLGLVLGSHVMLDRDADEDFDVQVVCE